MPPLISPDPLAGRQPAGAIPPTQAQQTFGTGPLVAGGALSPGAIQQMLFSGLPPAVALAQRNAGTAPAATPQGPGITATPNQAGVIQSATPGAFNGNPANGFPSEQIGTQPGQPPISGLPPQFQVAPGGRPEQQVQVGPDGRPFLLDLVTGQPQFLDGGGLVQATGLPDLAQMAPEAEIVDPFGGSQVIPPEFTFDPGPDGTGQVTTPQAPPAPITDIPQEPAPVPGAPPTVPGEQVPKAEPTGTPGQIPADKSGYYGQNGNLILWNDPKADFKNFMKTGGQAIDYVQNAINFNEGFWAQGIGLSADELRKVDPLPSDSTFQWQGSGPINEGESVNVLPGAFEPGHDLYISDPGVRDLLKKAENKAAKIALLSLDQGSTAERRQEIINLQEDLGLMRAALTRYGIEYTPTFASATPGGTLPGQNQGRFDVNTDIPNILAAIPKDLLQGFGNIDTVGKLQGLSELGLDRFFAQQELLQEQKAINELGQNLVNVEQNPLLAQARGVATDIASNPLAIDPQIVQNQLSGGFDRALEAGTQALGANAAQRRGVGLGSLAGIQSELERANRGDLARSQGDLSLALAQQERAGQLQGIDALTGVFGIDQSARNAAVQALSNAFLGQPTAIQNLGGQTQLALSLASIDQAQKAAEEAQNNQRLQLLASLAQSAGSAAAGAGAIA